MIVGIIFIVIAVISFIAGAIGTKEGEVLAVGVLIGMLLIFGIIIICDETVPEKTEFKYPISEYTLEYEVLTRGEQVDSTYVISKLVN